MASKPEEEKAKRDRYLYVLSLLIGQKAEARFVDKDEPVPGAARTKRDRRRGARTVRDGGRGGAADSAGGTKTGIPEIQILGKSRQVGVRGKNGKS